MNSQSLFSFRFQGITGHVFHGDFVRWGGVSFQIEAAKADLRAAIEAARK